jgi:mannose-6-phosphate isomerase-like protein (cupin superfamily)
MQSGNPLVLAPGAGRVHNVLGAPYRFLVTSKETDKQFALIESTAPPQSAVPLHVHTREDETFFILEGTFEITCGGRTFTLGQNGTAFLPRSIPHSYRNPQHSKARYLVLITPGGFEECLAEFARLPAEQPPAFETLAAIGRRYGLEFPAPS